MTLLSRISRHSGPAALVIAVLTLVLSTTGLADAAKRAVSQKLRPNAVLRLDAKAKVPMKALPKVPRAVRADSVGGQDAEALTASCAPTTVDLGTWCLSSALYPVTNQEVGKNNWFFATAKCVELGGYLPTAAQLAGAADRVKLASTITDSQLTAATDIDPSDGLKDRREMTATLVTTAAGASAAGSEGVSEGSKGDPKQGEPDPTPFPANPAPETLQYVTVYDNGDKGGAAGSKPVSQPENFRCAFNKTEGAAQQAEG